MIYIYIIFYAHVALCNFSIVNRHIVTRECSTVALSLGPAKPHSKF